MRSMPHSKVTYRLVDNCVYGTSDERTGANHETSDYFVFTTL
jgi:hypothetical protein